MSRIKLPKSIGVGLFITLMLCVINPTQAADLPDTIVKIKPSIVAIGTVQRTRSPPFRFLGTGFAVGDGSTIATNAHVVPETIDVEKFEALVVVPYAVTASGEIDVKGREPRIAQKIGLDPAHDLALLRVEGAPLPTLRLGSSKQVREGEAVGFTGYPIGHALGLFPVTHRGIVSSITPISQPLPNSRQLESAVIKRLGTEPFNILQLDATAYPGNSGSPVFDAASGDVIGIINMVFVKGTKEAAITAPSGITYAIPVEFLKVLIERKAR